MASSVLLPPRSLLGPPQRATRPRVTLMISMRWRSTWEVCSLLSSCNVLQCRVDSGKIPQGPWLIQLKSPRHCGVARREQRSDHGAFMTHRFRASDTWSGGGSVGYPGASPAHSPTSPPGRHPSDGGSYGLHGGGSDAASELARLQKHNFNLKLRVYYLEEVRWVGLLGERCPEQGWSAWSRATKFQRFNRLEKSLASGSMTRAARPVCGGHLLWNTCVHCTYKAMQLYGFLCLGGGGSRPKAGCCGQT
jgi:hypothetical protein